jgi:hypothetical protein
MRHLVIAMIVVLVPALAQTGTAGAPMPPQSSPITAPAAAATSRKAANGDERKVAAQRSYRNSMSADQKKTTPKVKPRAKAKLGKKGRVKPKRPDSVPVTAPSAETEGMEEHRQAILSARQPARLIRLIEEFERRFPGSDFAERARSFAAGASQALEIQRAVGLSGDFFEDVVDDAAYQDNLLGAVRGDMNAAYRIAVAYRDGTLGVAASTRRMEQWLRFSAELGHGRASWELAEIYNRGGFVADAARFEKKALDLGYSAPPRLPTRGY